MPPNRGCVRFLTPLIYAAKQNKRNSSHVQSTSSKKTKLSALIPGWFPFCWWRSWWESLKASAELRQSWGLKWAPGPVSTGHCPAPFEPVPVNQQERWQSGCLVEGKAWNPMRMAHRLAEIRKETRETWTTATGCSEHSPCHAGMFKTKLWKERWSFWSLGQEFQAFCTTVSAPGKPSLLKNGPSFRETILRVGSFLNLWFSLLFCY